MTSMTNRTSCSHPGPTVTTTTSTTSCNIVSASFTQRPNTEAETPKHKTLNNALVTTNEVLNISWKLSTSHAPSHMQHKITQDSRIILATVLKLENQHTRRTLGTLSWVYKPSDYPMVIGSWLSLLVVPVPRPTAS